MKYLLIGDLHFGVKNNSVEWLRKQKAYFRDVIIPYIKKNDCIVVVLGDIFDSRSSIGVQIISEVVALFQETLNSLTPVSKMYILAGNHDFFSPLDSGKYDNLNSIDAVLKRSLSGKVEFATNHIINDENGVFVSYNSFLDEEYLMKELNSTQSDKIFTHADLSQCPYDLNKFKVFSGHMHTPVFKGNLFTIGACYYLNFGDYNSQRGAWVLDDSSIKILVNDLSFKFYRYTITNESQIDTLKDFREDDYVEIKILEPLLRIQEVLDKLNKLKVIKSHLRIIPTTKESIKQIEVVDNEMDILSLIKANMPENLKEKFNIILDEDK